MGLLRAAFILVAGCVAAGLTFVGYALYTREAYHEKIFPGVHVSGVPLGGLTTGEAEALLREKLTFPFAAAFAFRYEDNVWHGIPEEFGDADSVSGDGRERVRFRARRRRDEEPAPAGHGADDRSESGAGPAV